MGECFISRRGGGDGGAGLNVVTGLSEPVSAKENTVWVKSDKAGKKYVFSEVAPENPSEGLIWFTATYSGIITKANVYTSGSWLSVDAYMYLSGAWVHIASPWDGSMYKDGTFIVDHTERCLNGTITYSDTYYSAKTKGSNLVCESYISFGPLDLTGRNILSMRAIHADSQRNVTFALFVAKVRSGTRDDAVAKAEEDITDKNEHTVTVDVSTLSGDGWYVYAGTNTSGKGWANARIVNVMEVSVS